MSPKQGQDDNKVDPRIRRTRQLLQQAFMELMQEKGFQSITVQDIARRAAINRVTFYAHFEDKYALLEHTIRQMFCQRLHGQLTEATSVNPENLRRLILTVCEFLEEIGGHCPPPYGQLEPLMEKQIKAELYEILLGWLKGTHPSASPGHPSPDQAAMVASWAIYGAAVQWFQQTPRQPIEEYVRQVLPLILGSFQPLTRS